MVAVNDKPILTVDTVDEWSQFLAFNPLHDGVRLRLRKKKSPLLGITYDEALDCALCVGWIDGQTASLDENYHLQVFTPRRARSVWSQRNREHIERLTSDGRMQPAGEREVERAKADGRWDAAYRQKGAAVPKDFQDALDANPAAAAHFANLSSQNRFACVFRIGNVKRAETCAKKIAGYIELLARGESLP